MTIAAGFTFDGGILLCADTKITTDAKTNESKICWQTYENADCATAFLFAGSVPYAKMAIAQCERAIASLDSTNVSIGSIEKAIELALREFYQAHVYPHPDRDEADFELLAGIWLDGRTYLLSSAETTVSDVPMYEFVGAGAYLMRYLVRSILARKFDDPPLPSLELVGLAATCGIEKAIEYDESCGGEAEFLVMRDNGVFDNSFRSIWLLIGNLPFVLQDGLWQMCKKLAVADSASEAESIVDEFVDFVRTASNDQIKWHLADVLEASRRND